MNKKRDVDNRPVLNYIFIGILVLALLVINYLYFSEHTSSNSEVINNYSVRDEEMNKTREPAVAGLFYPADVYQLSNEVDGYLSQAPSNLTARPHMLVVPHAGYIYSAAVAAKAYKKLLPFQNEIKKVILVGPSHRVYLQGAALSSAENFNTPLGSIPTDSEMTSQLSETEGFSFNNQAHAEEHSLEVQLPFLQKVLKDFSIVPVVYGQMKPEDLAAALKPYLGRNDTLVVFSADLSHYLDYETAKAVDAKTADMVATQKALDEHQSCGAIGINTALLLAREYTLQPQLLDMANSGDITGDNASVVGYASWIFNQESKKEEKKLTPLEQEVDNLRNFANNHGRELLNIVKLSLDKAVTKHKYKPSRKDYPDMLFNKGASFVTINKNGELRGCIGSLIPNRAIALDVAANTYAAATEDIRFEPLTAAELPELTYSISLMSDYERINFKDEADLLSQINAGTDGLVLRDGDRQGLFLPSVWKQLPDRQKFLNNLKLKAGLSPSYWSNQIKVYRFRVVEIKNDTN